MKTLRLGILIMLLISAAVFSCDKNKPEDVGIAVALSNYWDDQADLTATMEGRDATMEAIQDEINGLSKNSTKDDIDDIGALVETYADQCDDTAESFHQLSVLEDNIKPYGDNKGIFTSLCKGIYNKAESVAISTGRMVRSGWRVLSGQRSLRQVLRDPESGIPIVSDAADRLAKHNADRDAAIRQSILAENSQEGMIPLEDLEGTTPQEKLNSYLNLDDETSLKMNIRRDVMYWDAAERSRTADSAKKLGETGVKLVGDTYGGGVGEWGNEVLDQHMNEGQTPNDKGTCNLTVNRDGEGNPPITGNKTIIINKANASEDDPRITMIMDAPQHLEQELPTGVYDFIVIAEGHIRTFIQGVSILQDEVQAEMAKLLTIADNAIVIEGMVADPEVVTWTNTAHVTLTCVSTIGESLEFNWVVTGGEFTNASSNKNEFSFKPAAEGLYTVTCTVTDALGNTKISSLEVPVLRAELSFIDYAITAETYPDAMINPGEVASLELEFKNEGTADLNGSVEINGLNGIQVGFTPVSGTIEVGDSAIWSLNVQCPTQFTAETGEIEVLFNTEDMDNNAVTIRTVVEFPIDFYVTIDPIDSPVEDRVIYVTGKVANPLLTTATMVFDGDPDQAFQVNLNFGSFSQQIALSGADDPVDHEILVSASSGPITEFDTEAFTSDIAGTALRVTLSWDTPGTDVDLWVTDPNGEKCYYANSYTSSGLVLDFDDTDGYGPENTTTPEVIPGDYLVQVHYYSDHDSENAIGTSPIVVIRQNEGENDESVNTYYGYLSDTGDVWTVTTLSFNGKKWSRTNINSHSIQNSAELPAK